MPENVSDHDVIDEDVHFDDSVNEKPMKPKKKSNKSIEAPVPQKKAGLNYTAIVMMSLMIAPALFAVVTNVSD